MKWLSLKNIRRFAPLLVLGLSEIFIFRTILANMPLVYGDIAYNIPRVSQSNLLYAWGHQGFGTNVRLSPGAIRDAILLLLAPNSSIYFLLSFLLPLLIMPFLYYFLLRKYGINRWIAAIGGFASLANPVVFGDFLNGQTFWIYLTVPLIFHLTVRIFYDRQLLWQRFLALSLLFFASYAFLPPIIVPLVVIEGAFAILCLALSSSRLSLKQYGKILGLGILCVVIFALLVAPYFLIVPSGKGAYSPASLLADYYHNYARTFLTNTLRLAGNQGNGQSTLGYNVQSVINSIGFLFIGLIAAALILIRKRRTVSSPYLVLFALPLLLLIGFLELMATNTSFGIAVFKSQWIVATIRNPTKIFGLMLPFYVLSLALAVSILVERLDKRVWRYGLPASLAILLCVYSWPILRGDLGLFFRKGSSIANYQPDRLIESMAAQANKTAGRAIIIPSTHKDELNYQEISDNLSMLRLGGLLPPTEELVSQLQNAFLKKDSNFFKIVNMLGISQIYVKDNAAEYGRQPFSLFASVEGPDQAKAFLSSGGLKIKQFAGFSQFLNPESMPLVYSPKSINNLVNSDDMRQNLALYETGSAVTNTRGGDYSSQLNNYEAVSSLPSAATMPEGRALLYDPSLLEVQYYSTAHGSGKFLVIETLDPVSLKVMTRTETEMRNEDNIAILEGKRLEITPRAQRTHIRSGSHTLQLGQETIVSNAVADSGFESGSTSAGDASTGRSGKSDVYAKVVSDSKERGKSLLLGTAGHLAYFSKDLKLTPGSATYVVKFDYKNQKGSGPSVSLLKNANELLASSGEMPNEKAWTSYELEFESSGNSDGVSLNFYTDTAAGQRSENIFDNISTYRITQRDAATISLSAYSDSYALGDYAAVDIKPTFAPKNSVTNGSFEDDSLWGDAGDASIGIPGASEVSAQSSSEAVDGTKSLLLSAKNHTAYVTKPINNFDRNQVYSISFYYLNKGGKPPAFAVVDDAGRLLKSAQLEDGDGWLEYRSTFIPNAESKSAKIYLYSPAVKDSSSNLFDAISISAQPLISSYLVRKDVAVQNPQQIVKAFKEVNPTKIFVDMSAGSGMLILNESFHAGWRAFRVDKSYDGQNLIQQMLLRKPGIEVSQTSHVSTNGYANGWLINDSDTGSDDYRIVLEYWPQRYFYLGLLLSVLTFMSVASLFIYWIARRVIHRKDTERNGGEPTRPPAPTEVVQRVAKKTRRIVRL